MEPPQETPEKSHILAIIFPLQGHINPMIQLCQRLIAERLRVTLLTTASISRTLQREGCRCSSDYMAMEIVPDINVAGEDNSDIFEVFFRDYKATMSHGIPQIVQKYENTEFPVRAILYDSASPWCVDVAQANGLKGAVLFTQNCAVSSIFYHLYNGSLESPSDEGSGEILLQGLPAMGSKDLPSFDMNSYKAIWRHLIDQFQTCGKADWRLFNTFHELEDEVLKWMGSLYPILPIGPCIPSMYTDKRLKNNYEYGLNLSAQKAESCLQWLNDKQDHSVIYVSFGSLANLYQKQMEELASGLIDSGYSFIWVVRDPEHNKLPQDLTSSPSKNCKIVKWCNQLEVLSHRAVGCFITHCGWNSTLEALSLGVPMVAMPQWSDQTTNAKLVVDVWKTGVSVKVGEDGVVKKEDIVACVKEVMEGDKGNETRRNAFKWKGLARDAISEGGSSDKNIMKLVMEFKNSN